MKEEKTYQEHPGKGSDVSVIPKCMCNIDKSQCQTRHFAQTSLTSDAYTELENVWLATQWQASSAELAVVWSSRTSFEEMKHMFTPYAFDKTDGFEKREQSHPTKGFCSKNCNAPTPPSLFHGIFDTGTTQVQIFMDTSAPKKR